jgi:hypothetical protein
MYADFAPEILSNFLVNSTETSSNPQCCLWINCLISLVLMVEAAGIGHPGQPNRLQAIGRSAGVKHASRNPGFTPRPAASIATTTSTK